MHDHQPHWKIRFRKERRVHPSRTLRCLLLRAPHINAPLGTFKTLATIAADKVHDSKSASEFWADVRRELGTVDVGDYRAALEAQVAAVVLEHRRLIVPKPRPLPSLSRLRLGLVDEEKEL